MTDDAYEWEMAMALVNLKLEGAIYSSLKRGKNRVKQKPTNGNRKSHKRTAETTCVHNWNLLRGLRQSAEAQ